MAFRSISTNATPAHPLVITPPSGLANDDILVAWAIVDNQNAATYTLTGFTTLTGMPINLASAGGTDGGGMWVGYKKAASESGNYSISNTLSATMNGGIACWSGRDTTLFLHRSSVGSNNTANNSPWTGTTAAYSSNTTGLCDQLFIMFSDSKTGGTVTNTPPSGFTTRANVDASFFNSFIASQDAVASGATGVLSGIGTQAAAQSGWACASIALLDGGGGGGRTLFYGSGLDGLSTSGPKQFNPSLGYHRTPAISLAAYHREQSRRHREFMAKVSRAA